MGNQDFSEAVKLEVRRRAGFQCCRCHSDFGANPEKRKAIREMRDWWYERIEKMYPDNRQRGELEAISNKMDQLQVNQISLDDIKNTLFTINQKSFEYFNEMIRNMTQGTAISTGSAVVGAFMSASASPSPSPSPEAPIDDKSES